jgi:predicted aspartyl protease
MTEFKKYFLDMKLNDHNVSLKLDSGCDKPLINKTLWSQIGEPDLVNNGDTRSSATGVIPLKGGFLAKMNFAGIDFECPVQVADDDNTRNLIGRRALPFLVDFDWNKFISEGTHAMVPDLTLTDEIKKQQLMDDALKLISKRFHVKVSVDHKHFGMILDTGATCSIAGLAKWKELGEPHINPVNRSVESTSNQFIPILGECSLNIKYNGIEAQLPLLIADNDEIPAILGTNWFDSLQLDFNSIFRGIKFHKPIEQPVAVPE